MEGASSFKVLCVRDKDATIGMTAQPLQGTFGKSGSQGHHNAPHTENAEKREGPMRNILHENPDAISSLNATRLEAGSDPIHELKNIGIGEFLRTFRVIQDEGASARVALGPLRNAIENPASGNRGIHRWAGNLGQWSHASVE